MIGIYRSLKTFLALDCFCTIDTIIIAILENIGPFIGSKLELNFEDYLMSFCAANLFEVLVYAYKWHFNNIWWHSWAVNILKYIREFEQIFCDLWAALRLVILEYLSSKYVFEFIRMPLYGVNKHLSCIWCCLSTNTWVE